MSTLIDYNGCCIALTIAALIVWAKHTPRDNDIDADAQTDKTQKMDKQKQKQRHRDMDSDSDLTAAQK